MKDDPEFSLTYSAFSATDRAVGYRLHQTEVCPTLAWQHEFVVFKTIGKLDNRVSSNKEHGRGTAGRLVETVLVCSHGDGDERVYIGKTKAYKATVSRAS